MSFAKRLIHVSFLAAIAMALTSQSASAVVMSVNVARTGTASHPVGGTGFGGAPARAIDGGLGGSYSVDKTTTHTNNVPNSSWRVDLGADTEIDSIELFNRLDCCGTRLSNFRVSVLDSGLSEVFGQNVAGPVGASQAFAPPAGTSGRFVQVQLNGLNNEGNGHLSLREVVVLGKADVANSSNLALLYGTADQSSTRNGGGGNAAQFAIDGNTNGSFGAGSVTHTNNVANSFWEVDLNSTFHIDNVRLFNRTDCCAGRLSNFTISVFDDSHTLVSSVVNPGGVGSGYFAIDPGTQGRYVRIQFDGNNNDGNGVLSLAEVQIFGGGLQNIARNPNAVASQSSTRVGGGGNVASVAIDGITDGVFFGSNSVTHTLTENNPFWELEFGDEFSVDEIVLFNRTDGCCTGRLSDAEIRLFDGGGNELFLSTLGDTTGQSMFRIDVGGIVAYSMQVLLPGNGRILSLAEVQVFGRAIPEPATFAVMLMGMGGLAMRRRRAA